jgi:hypothetical protein
MLETTRVKVAFDLSLRGHVPLGYMQKLAGNHYQLENSESPDFVFFGPYLRPPAYPRLLRRFSPLQKPRSGRYVRIYWTTENSRPDFTAYDWLFTFDPDDMVQNERHMRRPVWNDENGDLATSPPFHPSPSLARTKFCNFIYSNPVTIRERFFDLLSKYRRVDAPGSSRHNCPPLGSARDSLSSRNSSDWQLVKLDYLAGYKFTIAFENSSYPGYTTEKIANALHAGSVPIYWGNPLISRDYNPKRFVNVHQFDSFESVVERVIELDQDEDAYNRMVAEPIFVEDGRAISTAHSRIQQRFERIFSSRL